MELVNRDSAFQNFHKFFDVITEITKRGKKRANESEHKLSDCVSIMASW